MKKVIMVGAILLLVCPAVPSHAFFDYLFAGSSSRDAIENSAVGDLRSWWTGNPAYVFNPYYSGPTNQNNANQGQQAPAPQQSEPIVNYVPAQGAYGGQAPQGYPQQQYQGAPQQYQTTPAYPPQYQQQQQYAPQQQAQPQYQQQPQYQAPMQAQQIPQQQSQAQQYAPQPYQGQQYGAQQMPQQYQNAPQGYQTAPQ